MKKKLESKKGFTLAELLIVVAIIAVLVAISIPVFNTQLEKSREAVDLANARSAYAELMTAILDGSTTVKSNVKGCTLTINPNGNSTAVISGLNQKVKGWTTSMTDVSIGGITPSGEPSGAAGTCTITLGYDTDGNAVVTVVFG